jgi:hypothetical protein
MLEAQPHQLRGRTDLRTVRHSTPRAALPGRAETRYTYPINGPSYICGGRPLKGETDAAEDG